MLAHLSIGTSTDRINLLNPAQFTLNNWSPGGYEPDSIWQESQLADFRQMAAYRDVTVIDRFDLILKTASQDSAARAIQQLRAMTRLCMDYWTTTWQTSVVYLAARANCETNMRYSVVHDARLIGESNPFGQPFVQHGKAAVMDELALVVERGPWLANAPGSAGTCVEISSQGPDNELFVLSFDGTDDEVNCGSDASIDDLPLADFTAEAWIRADSWGENDSGRIFHKGQWFLTVDNQINSQRGIRAFATHVVTTAETYTGTDDFTPDSQWHHVAAVWDQSELQWDIALDGIWVDTTITPGAGAYVSDAAADLYIGDSGASSTCFEGLIGWSRISDTLRYTVGVDFDPPDRCICPTVDGDTVALWCFTEGGGATTYDETANNNDGTITGATWGWSGCEKEYREATCEAQSVFVANKQNTSPLTHVYYWDNDGGGGGGAWSGNLIGAATPFDFLPAVPNDDDFVLFGTNTALADTGPFSSLIFDISTAIDAGTAQMEWRYCDSCYLGTSDPLTWAALTVQDNTNAAGAMTGYPFDTLGIGSVHWEQPDDWVECDPDPTGADALGVTGYWVACYFNAAGGAAVSPPEQDNRDIYTVTWPYIEFEADEVGGDMPALLHLSVDTRSAQDALSTTTDLYSQRVIVGLRAYDRGENFTSFINISDEQNHPDITVAVDVGMGAFADNTEAPTGRSSTYTAAGVDAMTPRVYIRVTPDWYGRFHAFVRGVQLTGNAGDIEVRLGTAPLDSSYSYVYTTTRTFVGTADDQILDFGEIALGTAADVFPFEVSHTFIIIDAGASAAATCIFYDLILIPVDEWAVDAEDMVKNVGSTGYTNDYWSHWELDGIRNPRSLPSFLLGTVSGKIGRFWRPITNGLPILQTGKKQRLWFLCARNDDYADVDDVHADSEICSSIQIWKNQRYTTLRGDQ